MRWPPIGYGHHSRTLSRSELCLGDAMISVRTSVVERLSPCGVPVEGMAL